MQRVRGISHTHATEIAEVWEEHLSGRGNQEGCDRFPMESRTEVWHGPDATCVASEDIPLGLRKWSAK